MQARTILDRSSSLSGLVRMARQHAGLTQEALAALLGTKQSAVSRWEGGDDEPRLATFVEIIHACGLSATLILDEGVDRAQVREHLAMTPVDRLRAVANVSHLRTFARSPGGS